ncbi:MAG: glycosyltransferase [Candidatus Thermoplasmatota archaeon]|nr:glycosyltransferase [Candidatus Thermoplasmatota archaeon]
MDILLLPKEKYPFRRVRLNQLFMGYFASGDDKVHWIAYGDANKTITLKNNEIHLIKPTPLKGNIGDVISRLAVYKKYKTASKILQSEPNIDIVLCNDGILEGIIGFFLAKAHGKKFAYYLSSLFFDMELNELKSMPSILTLFKTAKAYLKKPILAWLIKRADIFHPISEEMGKYYTKRGVPTDKIYPLPLCPARSMMEKRILYKYDHDKRFRMIYLGQITPVRRIDFLLEIINGLIKKSDVPVELMIVGKVFRKSYSEKLIRRIKELGLKNQVKLIDEVPFEEVTTLIDNSDLGLSILPPILAYRVSSPTKVVEYLSRGVPVVANKEIGDQQKVIEQSGGGIAPPYSLPEIINAITKFMNDIDNSRHMGMKGREWVLDHRNYEKMASDLKAHYKSSIKR